MRYLMIVLVLGSFLFAHEGLKLVGENSYTGLEVTEENPIDAAIEDNVLVIAVWLSPDDLLFINEIPDANTNDPNSRADTIAGRFEIKQRLENWTEQEKYKIMKRNTLTRMRAVLEGR